MLTSQDISTGLLLVSRTFDTIKQISELADRTNDLEIKELIVDLRSQIVDHKSNLIDFQEQIVLLKQENNKLKEKIADLENNNDEVIFKNGAYFKNNENQAFCSCCYETKGKLITLNSLKPEFSHVGNMICPNCQNPAQVK